jgi:hypothetical protein
MVRHLIYVAFVDCHKNTVTVSLKWKTDNWVHSLRETRTQNVSPLHVFCYFWENGPLKISAHLDFKIFALDTLISLALQSHKGPVYSENWKYLFVNYLNVMSSSLVSSSWLFYLQSGHCCYQAESTDLTQVPRLRHREGTASTLCTTSINSKTWSTCQ